MNRSKVAIVASNTIGFFQWIFGIFFLVMAGFSLFFYITGQMKLDSTSYTTIVFFAMGLALFLAGRKRRKSVKDFKVYVQHLSNNPAGYISDLAEINGESVDLVTKKLDYMIQKKYFVNAHINRGENRIIINSNKSISDIMNATTNITQNAQGDIQEVNNDLEYITVKCPNCGGNNKVELGKVIECDYCGSSIKGF